MEQPTPLVFNQQHSQFFTGWFLGKSMPSVVDVCVEWIGLQTVRGRGRVENTMAKLVACE